MHSDWSEYITVTQFQVTGTYSSSDLTKSKYRIGRVSIIENKKKYFTNKPY